MHAGSHKARVNSMSTPNDFPSHEQGNGKAGKQPPPGYFSQPGQDAPHYQQPGSQRIPAQSSRNFKFEMPRDMPSTVREVMPVGGMSGIFRTDGLPQFLKISYITWLVTAAIWLFFTFFSFLGSLFRLLLSSHRGAGLWGIVVSVIAVALIAAIILCAMKLKEGKQWARLALSAIVVVGFCMIFVGGTGGGMLGVVATVLMWLPESSAWLESRRRA